MIIAIDETGDFAPYSNRYNFFVAALLDQKDDNLVKKQEQFNLWKQSVPKEKFTKFNEVKGTELSDADLYVFTKNVLLSPPVVRNVQIRVKPNENKRETVEKFKAIEVKVIRESQKHFKTIQDSKNQTFYERLEKWYRKRNYQHYLKLGLLEYTIARSIRLAVGYGVVDSLLGSNDNLMKLAIKIDADFVNKEEERKYFKELLRQTIRNVTNSYPIPMAEVLIQQNNPFAKQYVLKNGMINLEELLIRKCNYYNSYDSFEVQIADILGTIIHRFNNHENRCKDCMELMDQKLGKANQIKVHRIMNPTPNDNVQIVLE